MLPRSWWRISTLVCLRQAFDSSQLSWVPSSCTLALLWFVTIVVGAIVAHTCFALREFLKEVPNTRHEIICRTRRWSTTLHTSDCRKFFNLVFHFWNLVVSGLICYFSCRIFVSEIWWSSSGPYRNRASQEVEGLRRDSMCILTHVERER